jgi:hypothetical protein
MDQLIAKYNGKTKGYPTDSDYLGECLSIVKLYIKECFGINPPPSGTNSAYGYWTNFPAPLGEKFEKVANTPTGVPQKGDIIIWKPWTENKYGHIAIFVDGNTNSFNSFDQNWGGKQAHKQSHNYTNVIGWLHPKQNATGDEMIPENLLKGELFQYNGKPEVYWHIPNPEAFAKYVARTDLIEFRAEPTVEKIVEKPVDRPETLKELENARTGLVEANKTISDLKIELENCLKTKRDLFDELDLIYSSSFIIKRNILTKLIEAIKSWLKGKK